MAKKPGKGDRSTRQRLLVAACEVFAQKGYGDATVAEICERARANIAAVNYHFGGKERLYAEAWRTAFQRSLEAHPADGGVPADAPPERQLYGHILSLMKRISDPQNYEYEIMHKELVNPTGLLVEVMRESIEPMRRRLGDIVRELLGPKVSDQRVQLCRMSIMAQCFFPMMRARHRKAFPGGPGAGQPPLDFGVEVLADQITRFSLAGIREVRRQIENGELQDMEGPRKGDMRRRKRRT